MRQTRLLWATALACVALALLGWGLSHTRAAPQALTYPPDTALTPLGDGQPDPLQRRAAYVALFDGLWRRDALDWTAVPITQDGSVNLTLLFPPGMAVGLPGDGYVQPRGEWNVARAYALHPRRIAVFYPTLRDEFDQVVAWEAGACEQLLRLYLLHDAFATLSETQVSAGALADYDLLMLPALRVGWADEVAAALGDDGLAALYDFVAGGGHLYAQGNAAWLVEAAGLISAGTVDLGTRVQDPDNRGEITFLEPAHPLALSWLSPSLYVLDEPALNGSEDLQVIATFSDTTAPGTVALAVAGVGDGRVVLLNGHPTSVRDDAPQVIDALLWAMSERGGLHAQACQTYDAALPCDLLPAYEPSVSVRVTSTFRNTWDGPLEGLRLTETVSADYLVPGGSIVPAPAQVVTGGDGATRIVWDVASVPPGYHDFSYLAVTAAPSGTTGGLLSRGQASFLDPFWSTELHPAGRPRLVQRAGITVTALMAARLVGDRDIELDVIYPLPAGGFYFDIALPLENKEETDAYHSVVTDVVALLSPIVDVWDQRLIPHVISDSISPSGTTALSQTLWAVNEIFFYDTPVPLYPMPDRMDGIADTGDLLPGVHYNLDTWLQGPRRVYTFAGPFTTTLGYTHSVYIPPQLSAYVTLTVQGDLHLPALEMAWDFGTLIGYDYQEPAVRYGLWSHEAFDRPVFFASDPHPPALILETSGGSVFTNLGGHPIPYEEYLSHGVIYIPQGHTLPRVTWQDLWGRDHEMELRTVFYDIVPFPPPEYHAVVNTTYEMRVDQDGDGQRETRVLEYPTRQEADLTLLMKSYSNFHPDMPPLEKDETMIDQAVFRGLGFELHPAAGNWWDSWRSLDLQGVPQATELVTVVSTPAYEHLYFQQYLESQQREAWVISATLSVPEARHYEGRVKVDDGARFVYHQKAAGPSRYEVFDAHTLVAFGHSTDASVEKQVAPVVISTYSDTLYSLIKVEDPWDPRDPGWGPFIRSYGLGDLAATTYVGGRYTDTLLFGRVSPGDATQIRLSIRNNQTGVTITDLLITPLAPPGISVTVRPPSVTMSIAPIFFDFPFLHTTSISDGWRSIWYYDVQVAPGFTDTGKVISIPFQVTGDGLPESFKVPPAQLAVMDPAGQVTTVWGQATDLQVGDGLPAGITPQDAFFATPEQAFALESALDAADLNAVTDILDTLLPVGILTQSLESGTWVTFTLPASPTLDATRMPWWQGDTPHGAYYLVLRAAAHVEGHGKFPANSGPQLTYRDDFQGTWQESGAPQYVYAQGAWLVVAYTVEEVGPVDGGLGDGFVSGAENEARVTIDVENRGDYVALGATLTVTLGTDVSLLDSSVPTQTQGEGWVAFWLGDMAPGQQESLSLLLTGVPDPPPGEGAWLLIEQTAGRFQSEFPAGLGSRIVTVDQVLAGELRVGPGNVRVYLPLVLKQQNWWPGR